MTITKHNRIVVPTHRWSMPAGSATNTGQRTKTGAVVAGDSPAVNTGATVAPQANQRERVLAHLIELAHRAARSVAQAAADSPGAALLITALFLLLVLGSAFAAEGPSQSGTEAASASDSAAVPPAPATKTDKPAELAKPTAQALEDSGGQQSPQPAKPPAAADLSVAISSSKVSTQTTTTADPMKGSTALPPVKAVATKASKNAEVEANSAAKSKSLAVQKDGVRVTPGQNQPEKAAAEGIQAAKRQALPAITPANPHAAPAPAELPAVIDKPVAMEGMASAAGAPPPAVPPMPISNLQHDVRPELGATEAKSIEARYDKNLIFVIVVLALTVCVLAVMMNRNTRTIPIRDSKARAALGNRQPQDHPNPKTSSPVSQERHTVPVSEHAYTTPADLLAALRRQYPGRVVPLQAKQNALSSNKGIRSENEDYAIAFGLTNEVNETRECVLIADGCGGHPGGRDASHLAARQAAEALVQHRQMPPELAVTKAFAYAAAGLSRVGCYWGSNDLRTTLIVVVATRDNYHMGWIGDGGCVIHRSDGAWRTLLVPHRGAAQNILTASLGPRQEGEPSFISETRLAGDRLYVGTDGIFDMVRPGEFFDWLEGRIKAGDAAQQRLDELLAHCAADGRFDDNLTAGLLATPPASNVSAIRTHPAASPVNSLGAVTATVTQ